MGKGVRPWHRNIAELAAVHFIIAESGTGLNRTLRVTRIGTISTGFGLLKNAEER
jgi:hypothetical protein